MNKIEPACLSKVADFFCQLLGLIEGSGTHYNVCFYFPGDVKPAMLAISNLANRDLDPTNDDEVRRIYKYNQLALYGVHFKA